MSIEINIFRDKDDIDKTVYGFKINGHASSVVCAAVSILSMNTANSIEALTDTRFDFEYDDEGGYMLLLADFSDGDNVGAKILLNSFVVGVTGIQQQYSDEVIVFNGGGDCYD